MVCNGSLENSKERFLCVVPFKVSQFPVVISHAFSDIAVPFPGGFKVSGAKRRVVACQFYHHGREVSFSEKFDLGFVILFHCPILAGFSA